MRRDLPEMKYNRKVLLLFLGLVLKIRCRCLKVWKTFFLHECELQHAWGQRTKTQLVGLKEDFYILKAVSSIKKKAKFVYNFLK